MRSAANVMGLGVGGRGRGRARAEVGRLRGDLLVLLLAERLSQVGRAGESPAPRIYRMDLCWK
jgi:hypothetical protein